MKKRKARPVALNTLQLALHGAAKPSRQEVDEVLRPIRAAAIAFREAVATELQWSILSGSVEVAKAIEHQGVVRGLHEHLTSAEEALQSIFRRAMQAGSWRSPTLYYQELDALATFVDLHAFQVRQLSRKEFIAAADRAQGTVRAGGFTATVVRDLGTLPQQARQ